MRIAIDKAAAGPIGAVLLWDGLEQPAFVEGVPACHMGVGTG